MRIDNWPTFPDRPPEPKENEFWKKLTDILRVELDMEYADIVHAYGQIEKEFVNSANDDEIDVLETKRHIAERILCAGRSADQPFEVCRDNWNALVELGFQNVGTWCHMAWVYADSCLDNGHYDVGLDVLDMVATEIHRRLEEPGLTKRAKKYYDGELINHEKLREGLVAFKSSEAEGIAWEERREAEIEARQTDPQEGRVGKLVYEMDVKMHAIDKTSSERGFVEVVREYRQFEAEFLGQLESTDDEYFVQEVQRRTAIAILREAHKHHEPFDVCRNLWNDVLRWGFRNLEQRCVLTRVYAECCVFNHQPDAGLALVKPLLAELQKHLDEDTYTEMPSLRYRKELARLQKLRDELQALKK